MALVDYRRPAFIPSHFRASKKTIENISRLCTRRGVNGDGFYENNRQMLLHAEKKNETFTKTLMNKLTKPSDFVCHPFSLSNSICRGYVLLPGHNRCIIWNKELDCEAHAKIKLVEVVALQILNDNSDIPGTPEFVQEEWLFSQEVEKVNTRKPIIRKCFFWLNILCDRHSPYNWFVRTVG